MLLGSIAAGATTTFQTTFIPQFIVARNSDGSATNITSFQINAQGDGVILNLPNAGWNALRNIRQYNQSNTVGDTFQLAQGLVTGKNTYWTITNAAAVQLDVYGFSKQKDGKFYLTYLTQLNLANSGTDYTDFAFIAIPAATSADSWTLVYNDGTTQVSSINEIRADLFYTQNFTQIAVDNVNPARLKLLTYIPAASRDAYVLRYQSVKGNVDSALIARA